jgi:hypothetical protein
MRVVNRQCIVVRAGRRLVGLKAVRGGGRCAQLGGPGGLAGALGSVSGAWTRNRLCRSKSATGRNKGAVKPAPTRLIELILGRRLALHMGADPQQVLGRKNVQGIDQGRLRGIVPRDHQAL